MCTKEDLWSLVAMSVKYHTSLPPHENGAACFSDVVQRQVKDLQPWEARQLVDMLEPWVANLEDPQEQRGWRKVLDELRVRGYLFGAAPCAQ